MKKILALLMFLITCAAIGQVTNISITPLPSATYTATTVNSPDQTNANFKGGHIIIYVASVNSGTYTPKIQGKDQVSGLYYDILTGSAISASGTTVLKVYPGIGVVANGSASDILPAVWRVQLNGASTPSMVLSVQANMGY